MLPKWPSLVSNYKNGRLIQRWTGFDRLIPASDSQVGEAFFGLSGRRLDPFVGVLASTPVPDVAESALKLETQLWVRMGPEVRGNQLRALRVRLNYSLQN